MPQGTIKWFSCTKGYGFITSADDNGEVFVHFSAIEGTGYRKLKHGERVEFEIVRAEKGPQAASVKRVQGN